MQICWVDMKTHLPWSYVVVGMLELRIHIFIDYVVLHGLLVFHYGEGSNQGPKDNVYSLNVHTIVVYTCKSSLDYYKLEMVLGVGVDC